MRVVRIGAVNCGDDWALCQQQQIHSFPSLIMYPQVVLVYIYLVLYKNFKISNFIFETEN